MSDKLILQAFQTATLLAVKASIEPALPVQMLGRVFEPPDDQKYLQLVFIPNNRTGETWGKEKTYQGLVRLVLHWPINDEGVYDPIDLIMSVASYFDKTNTLRNGGLSLKLYEDPNFTGMVEPGSELLFPVSMPYRSFVP